MAKSIHALIYPHAPDVIVERRMLDLAYVPEHKRAWWRPVVTVGDSQIDPATQRKTGPVTTIEANRVVDTFTVSSLTAQELSDRADSEINSVDYVLFKIAFDHENRIRALEGKAVVTAAQFKAAIKARL